MDVGVGWYALVDWSTHWVTITIDLELVLRWRRQLLLLRLLLLLLLSSVIEVLLITTFVLPRPVFLHRVCPPGGSIRIVPSLELTGSLSIEVGTSRTEAAVMPDVTFAWMEVAVMLLEVSEIASIALILTASTLVAP